MSCSHAPVIVRSFYAEPENSGIGPEDIPITPVTFSHSACTHRSRLPRIGAWLVLILTVTNVHWRESVGSDFVSKDDCTGEKSEFG